MVSENGIFILSHPKEIEPSEWDLVVCSGGRGGVIVDQIRKFSPIPYRQIHLIDPQVYIPPEHIDVVSHVKSIHYLKLEQLLSFLSTTTEGRPIAIKQEYVYGINTIPRFQADITRIALLKLRALFPILYQAYLQGQECLNIDAASRDTGQIYKVPRDDSFVYQSHPGDKAQSQYDQFERLFDSDYALIGTVFVMLKGSIPTKTPEDLIGFYNLIYSLANESEFRVDQLPSDLDIQLHAPFFVTSLRIDNDIPDINEVIPNLKLANIPGGVLWDHHRMADLMETWGWTTSCGVRSYLAMPSENWKDLLLGINSFNQGDWHHIHGMLPGDAYATEQFTAIRQGMPPAFELSQILRSLHNKTKPTPAQQTIL